MVVLMVHKYQEHFLAKVMDDYAINMTIASDISDILTLTADLSCKVIQTAKIQCPQVANPETIILAPLCYFQHYGDVKMGTIASQITSLTIVYSTVYSDADQNKTSKLRVTGLCAGNSPGTGEFPAQMTSNAENVSIWWHHHEVIVTCLKTGHW